MFSLNVCPRNMVEDLTFVMKVLVDPIQSVWNRSRRDLKNVKFKFFVSINLIKMLF